MLLNPTPEVLIIFSTKISSPTCMGNEASVVNPTKGVSNVNVTWYGSIPATEADNILIPLLLSNTKISSSVDFKLDPGFNILISFIEVFFNTAIAVNSSLIKSSVLLYNFKVGEVKYFDPEDSTKQSRTS